jgi:hypothetical protein
MALDPTGRELVQSLGAALFNVRVALAARGWAVRIDRFPRPGEPDLAAVVRPVPGAPEARLPLLADAVHRRRTHRAGFLAEEVPDELLDYLTAAAAAEDTALVAVPPGTRRRLVAQLTRQADAVQNGNPDCRADLERWRPQPASPAATDPPADPGRRTVDSDSGEDRTFLLISSRTDDPMAWLRSGEALERVLLELARQGWAASPMTQALEVPMTRARLRSGVTCGSPPQLLLRIGFGESRRASARRLRDDVVRNSTRPLAGPSPAENARPDRLGSARSDRRSPHGPRPFPDGRGGTTWI